MGERRARRAKAASSTVQERTALPVAGSKARWKPLGVQGYMAINKFAVRRHSRQPQASGHIHYLSDKAR